MKELNDISPSLIQFFEQCYRDGDTEIKLEGFNTRHKQAYRAYYEMRKDEEKEKHTESL